MDTVAAWVAAIAALCAAGSVAWQSWETRKSAQASRDAAEAAQAGITLARGTLELTRAQAKSADEALGLAREQATEAIRARIDAGMPAITVYADNIPAWPPREPSAGGFGTSNELPYGRACPVMHVPRDNQRQIAVRVKVNLSNNSDRPVELHTGCLRDDAEQELVQPLRLASGDRVSAWFWVVRSLETWVQILEARETGEPGDEATLGVRYVDPSDSGAIDNWTVAVGGTPIERVSDLAGGFRIIQGPSESADPHDTVSRMGSTVSPRDRRYYRSRSKGLLLGEEI